MEPSLIAFIIAGIAALIAFLFYNQTTTLKAQLNEAKGKKLGKKEKDNDGSEKKLKAVKNELGAAKESLAKKTKQLEELRATAQKKAKKEAKKSANEPEPKVDLSVTEDAKNKKHTQEVTKLKQALLTLQGEVDRTQKEAGDAIKNAESEALSLLNKKLDAEKEAAKSALAAKNKVQSTLNELRESIKRKSESRPDVEGSGLDLKALDTEVVQELAKFYRKGEHFEKLYHVNQGQLQLAKDKNQELQKRYYAVCRELAVAATDGKEVSEADAVRLAEAVSERTDRSIRAKGAPKNGGPKNGAPKNGARAEQAADSKDGGEGKKRRRRRPAKGPSEGVDASASEGAESSAEAANESPAKEGAKASEAADVSEALTERMSADEIAGAIAKPNPADVATAEG